MTFLILPSFPVSLTFISPVTFNLVIRLLNDTLDALLSMRNKVVLRAIKILSKKVWT